MYARTTTVRGDPRNIDDAIAYLRDEAMPLVQDMPGCIGLSMMCDRDSGRCIATTAWETEEAMHDSEGGMHDMRRRYADVLGGQSEVQEWEIALLHRLHHAPDGACCRVLWSSGNPDDAERVLDAVRMNLLARMEDLPGFCSVSLLLDRDRGRGATAVVYESRQAMDAATAMAKPLREEFNRLTGWTFTEIAEFDLALAHLRVPETV
ncbi:antibiotic biosynthesis monooxygenase [Blastococcus sp. PRF04-17]|uniref:antibiotic biosynthesis monooxygenase n=1 Tax=Blastococcus sp. PRF04-17 TaxID=2933797 RepID=UPI001FF33197|nr:antibiotic biosynthesis monooxygenase [Blastococcus sp. PRF04-17]UOY01849.1 antibiotic biosynthesis monooxygenase [Blastococcus sp. PRF04-17]